MSEAVERHMESMTEEIEEMQATKLFTVEETKKILKKRRYYVYKINSPSKDLQDFKGYIHSEKILLEDIRMRRNKFKIGDKKASIEYKILKRIKHLYEIAMQLFSNNYSLYMSYFKFCENANFGQSASLVIQNMIKTFSHMPDVWLVAADWYLKTDVGKAKNILHKGLAMHKDDKALYNRTIQVQLLHREKDDDFMCNKFQTYLEVIFKNIKDLDFYLGILTMLEPHKYTKPVQDTIIKWLLENYSNEQLMWHYLAQREKKGHFYGTTEDPLLKPYSYFLERCSQKYEEGLQQISAEKKEALYLLYLDEFLMNLDKPGNAHHVQKAIALKVLQEAEKQFKLPEKYYVQWAMLLTNENDVIKLIEKGLKELPDSVELWKLYLRSAVIKENADEFNKIFKKGILQLKEKSAPLWTIAVRFYNISATNDIMEMVYEDAVKQPKPISDILKPEYLQWVAFTKGINEARNLYNNLANKEPYCKALHTTMAKIESVELDIRFDQLENVYKLACEQFGHEDVDVWINLLEFYLTNQKDFTRTSDFDVNEKCQEVYRNAEIKLKDNELLLLEFKDKFESLKTSDILSGPKSN